MRYRKSRHQETTWFLFMIGKREVVIIKMMVRSGILLLAVEDMSEVNERLRATHCQPKSHFENPLKTSLAALK